MDTKRTLTEAEIEFMQNLSTGKDRTRIIEHGQETEFAALDEMGYVRFFYYALLSLARLTQSGQNALDGLTKE